MPVDTRRLPVPEESKSPACYAVKSEKVEKLITDGKRQDGRNPEQLRPIFLRTGTISQAKGSAYMEMDRTKVICAVYGPREVTKREDFSLLGALQCEVKFATFSSATRGQHQQDADEKAWSRLLLEALQPAVMLDKFPKARMDIFITVLEDDGSAIAAALCAASVALADAGVEMYDLVVGCNARQYGSDLLLDPTTREEYSQLTPPPPGSEQQGGLLVGYMPSLDQVACLSQQGDMDITSINKGLEQVITTCQKLYPVLQQTLTAAVKLKLQAATAGGGGQ